MAGGPTTPALVLAAADAGALGMLAAGYKTAAEMRAEIDAVRSATSGAFGVNVFVPGEAARRSRGAGGLRRRAGEGSAPTSGRRSARRSGTTTTTAPSSMCSSRPAPLVSFTFGCPDPDVVRALQAAGSARRRHGDHTGRGGAGATAGVDCLCVQGSKPGTPGHLRQRRPPGTGSPARLPSRRRAQELRPAAHRGRGHRRSRRRGRRPGGGGDTGTARDGVPAVHRERRPSPLQGGTGRSPLHLRPPSPGPSAAAGPAAW